MIREQHVDESANWVVRHASSEWLSFSEANIVAEINRYHSRKYDLSSCSEQRACNGHFVRPQLLAAYLRLADAMEVAHERVDDPSSPRFLFLQEVVRPNADRTLFHWIKSFVVSAIVPSVKSQTIFVEFQVPLNSLPSLTTGEGSAEPGSNGHLGIDDNTRSIPFKQARLVSGFHLLTQFILDELRQELETVEQALALGGISSFHFVMPSDEVVVLPVTANAVWAQSLSRVVNYMRVAYSPNSTGTARAALTAIQESISVMDEEIKKQNDPVSKRARSRSHVRKFTLSSESVDEVKLIVLQLKESLEAQLSERSCHNELRRITKFVNSWSKHDFTLNRTRYETWKSSLLSYSSKMQTLVDYKGITGEELSRRFWDDAKSQPMLERSFKSGQLTVLLFGNSSTVAEVLADFKKHHIRTLDCYIAEGRPKTKHGARNVPIYLDAEAYARAIRTAAAKHKISPKSIRIRIIPDVVSGTVLDPFHAVGRNSEHPPADVVLFGANGVFWNDDVRVAHTAGHLSIAAAAKYFSVPAYVVAASVKIQATAVQTAWRDAVRSEGEWIASKGCGLGKRLEDQGVETLWNPREEQIPLELLTAIVTEKGICRPGEANGTSREQLRKWEQEIDNELGQNETF
jgi:translation initiation factor 2B subunit (eIF-2B alpha/beta/delta family)